MVSDKYFVFNGKKSSDFNVWVTSNEGLSTPKKRYTEVEVPGRNGNLIIEENSFANQTLTLKDCFAIENVTQNIKDINKYLNLQKGYQRLELSWIPDEYMLAHFAGNITPNIKDWDKFGKFDLTFNCKPQRFLKSGEEPICMIPPTPEGLTAFHTPKYSAPIWESIIPTNAYDIKVTLMAAGHPVSYNVTVYYDDDTTSQTQSVSLSVGASGTTNISSETRTVTHWKVNFTNNSADDFDDIQVRIEGFIQLDGHPFRLDGTVARLVQVTNPTGFECRPMFKCWGNVFPIQWIRKQDGEGWTFNCDDYSEITQKIYIDCENEYLYYIDNGVKKNLTNKLTILHTDAEDNTLMPSFPVLGEETTDIQIYTIGAEENSLVEMTPRWFRI